MSGIRSDSKAKYAAGVTPPAAESEQIYDIRSKGMGRGRGRNQAPILQKAAALPPRWPDFSCSSIPEAWMSFR